MSNTKSSPCIGDFFPLDAILLLPFSLYRHWQMMKSSAKNFGNSSVLMLGSPTQYNADFFQILNLALDTLDFNFIRLLRCIHSLYLNDIYTINNDLYYYNSSTTYVKVVYANYTIILLHNFEYILHITIWIILYN